MRYANVLLFVLAVTAQPALALMGEPVFVQGHIIHAADNGWHGKEKHCTPAKSGRQMCALH